MIAERRAIGSTAILWWNAFSSYSVDENDRETSSSLVCCKWNSSINVDIFKLWTAKVHIITENQFKSICPPFYNLTHLCHRTCFQPYSSDSRPGSYLSRSPSPPFFTLVRSMIYEEMVKNAAATSDVAAAAAAAMLVNYIDVGCCCCCCVWKKNQSN
jgi:hypothetical protein